MQDPAGDPPMLPGSPVVETPDRAPGSAPAADPVPAPEPDPEHDPEPDPALELGPDGLIQPVLVPPRGLVAATLVLLLATAAVAIAVAPAVQPVVHADLRLDSWLPDDRQFAEVVRRQDQLAAVAAALPNAPTPSAALIADVVRWLAAEAQLGVEGVRADPTARALLGQAEETLRAVAIAHGAQAVAGLAVAWGRQVAATFAATADLATARGVTIRDLFDTPEGASLLRVAPGLGPLLANTGLERLRTGPEQRRAADLVVQALAQARFLQFAVRVTEPPRLDPGLHAILLRFRIEAHEGLRIERKLALIDELAAADPSYPDQWVRGVLWAREGRCDVAGPAFARAVAQGQRSAGAAANFAWCQRQLRAR